MMGSRLLKYEMEKRRLASGMIFVFGEQNYFEQLVPFGPLCMSVYFEVDSEMLNALLAKITVYHEDLMTPTKNATKIKTPSKLKIRGTYRYSQALKDWNLFRVFASNKCKSINAQKAYRISFVIKKSVSLIVKVGLKLLVKSAVCLSVNK